MLNNRQVILRHIVLFFSGALYSIICSSNISDCVVQMRKEVSSWPYSFPSSPDFLKSDQRGSVSGRLSVNDQYASQLSPLLHLLHSWSIYILCRKLITLQCLHYYFSYLKVGNGPARFAHVGLAAPGEVGSWEFQIKVSTRFDLDSIINNEKRQTHMFMW